MLQRIARIKRPLLRLFGAAALLSTVACQAVPQGLRANIPLGQGLRALNSTTDLPKPITGNFMWGVSSAGYQSEGNNFGSQWYYWELAGKTKHKAGKAVDFYNRYEEDILLAKEMGANSFRLSIEWARIEPQPGMIDRTQLAYYKNLVQTIRKHGMEPLVTLVHFTYPHWLDFDTDQDGLSGWDDPDTIDAFLEYAGVVVRELSPDVTFWITFNEPNLWVLTFHLAGRTPPGRKNPLSLYRAARNVVHAHGRVYDRIHGINPKAMVSSNVFQIQYNPFAKSSKTVASSATAMTEQGAREFSDTDWFWDTMQTGEFAMPSQRIFAQAHFKQGGTRNEWTFNLLGKFDYIALDYYYRFTRLEQALNAHETWRMPLYPEGLYNVLINYQRRFRKPIVIAENGMGTFNNEPRADGWKRSDHIVQHMYQVQRAMQDGANVIGYYHWSITDNYEWGEFDSRFGLYRVEALSDPTLKRIPTDGVAAYKNVIGSGGVTGVLLQQHPGPQR